MICGDKMKNVISFGHDLLKQFVLKDDITIDMTAGNGNDTLFLASISRKVFAFDIQEQAITNTRRLLEKNNISNVELINSSHEFVRSYVKDLVGAVIFNLGYLPRGNKTITTKYQTTIPAIESVLKLLKPNGICVIVVYPGHPAGYEESIFLEKHLKNLSQEKYQVLKYKFINQANNPPYLLAIYKK